MSSLHNTRRLVVIALMSAIAFILFVFVQFALPILPPTAGFLKVDLSILPVMLAWSWYGVSAGVWVLIIRSILKILLANEGFSTWIGLPVNILVSLAFLLVFAAVMAQQWSIRRLIMAGTLATLAATAVALLLNWLVALPLYAQLMHFDVAQVFGSVNFYLAAIATPFNLIQGVIWTGILILLLPQFRRFLR